MIAAIDRRMPEWDVRERHAIRIAASPVEVWDALHGTDFGALTVPRVLLGLRALPERFLKRHARRPAPRSFRLEDLAGTPFGLLVEDPPRELLLGVHGRFWRPLGNLERFRREDFDGPVPPGLARALWDFRLVEEAGADGRPSTRLSTETRVRCGDASGRRRFRAYWLLVRPGSGWIRRVVLRTVRRVAEASSM